MSKSARGARLAVFTKNRKNPAYVGARLGADRIAASHGCTTTHYVPEVPDDVDEQQALLKAAHAARPDAVLIAPAHPTVLNAILQRIQADGIPVLCFVSRPEDIDCTSFVGSDDRALARGIADYLLDLLPVGGSIVTLEGNPNSTTSAPRGQGFRDAVDARSGVRIVGSRSGDFMGDGGQAAMAALLAAEPQIDGVLAANDFMALGAIDAMHAARRMIPIVGVNATPEGVQAIKAGDLLASASFDAMKIACLGVEAAIRVLSGEPVPRELLLPVEVVDHANCAAWDRPYAERPLPRWADYVRG
jgi:ribose transport system substrate-binding protein